MSNNVLQHHGVKGQKWGVRRFLRRFRKNKDDAQSQVSKYPKKVNERQREDYFRTKYLHRDQLSAQKINAINKRLEAEQKMNQLTRAAADERARMATEERNRKAKARGKMFDAAVKVIKNMPIENYLNYDRARYKEDPKYQQDVDKTIEYIKNIRSFAGSFEGIGNVLSQDGVSDDTLRHYGVIGMKWGQTKNNIFANRTLFNISKYGALSNIYYNKNPKKSKRYSNKLSVKTAKGKSSYDKLSEKYARQHTKDINKYVNYLNNGGEVKVKKLNRLRTNARKTQAVYEDLLRKGDALKRAESDNRDLLETMKSKNIDLYDFKKNVKRNIRSARSILKYDNPTSDIVGTTIRRGLNMYDDHGNRIYNNTNSIYDFDGNNFKSKVTYHYHYV